ncbi:MAG: PTS sugar transporter subunit IIA [Spirochaetaceae bacterium]|nr:MAG: PTS sugar transporter subunit IIA [Spirochaetaceae bacterium]
MNIRKALTLQTVTVNLPGTTKQEVIEALVDLASAGGKVKDRAAALDAVLAREARMTTGLEHGVAIPHGKTDAVDELVAAVGITREPVDFAALDGNPCRIFVMTISSIHRTGPHIQFLSEISRLLKSADVRDRLLAARDNRTLLSLLQG